MLAILLDKFIGNQLNQIANDEEDSILELTPEGLKDIDTNKMVHANGEYDQWIIDGEAVSDYTIIAVHDLPNWVTGEFPRLIH
jgi:hypothetical protein